MRLYLVLSTLPVLAACGPNYATELPNDHLLPIVVKEPVKAPLLGTGDKTAASVTLTEIAGPSRASSGRATSPSTRAAPTSCG